MANVKYRNYCELKNNSLFRHYSFKTLREKKKRCSFKPFLVKFLGILKRLIEYRYSIDKIHLNIALNKINDFFTTIL